MALPVGRDVLDNELTTIGLLLLDIGAEADSALALARRCIATYETVLVDAVDARAQAVAELHDGIEQRVETLLATQAPVATDLRAVLGSLRVAHHVERAARNAHRAAHALKPGIGDPAEGDVRATVEEMADRAVDMLQRALVAYSARNAEAAAALVAEDDRVDALHDLAFDRALSLPPALRTWGLGMLFAARWFERAADHACGIADRAIYVVGAPRGV